MHEPLAPHGDELLTTDVVALSSVCASLGSAATSLGCATVDGASRAFWSSLGEAEHRVRADTEV